MQSLRNSIIPDGKTEPHVDLVVNLFNIDIGLRPYLDSEKRRKLMTQQHRERLFRYFAKHLPLVLDELPYYPTTNHRVEWVDSDDLATFIDDYRTLKQIINNFIESKILSGRGLEWIQLMTKHQLDRQIDMDLTLKSWENTTPDLVVFKDKEWHGLKELMPLQDAILVGVVQILNHRIEVKRCVNDGCERILRIPKRGGKTKVYCGRSCQVKAYQERRKSA